MRERAWVRRTVWWFAEEESGQGMVEYVLAVMLVAMAAIITLSRVAPPLVDIFGRVDNEF
ncbi:MAG: Flp family type IVb pilin [Clostridium sp.]|nr:Flp family type IVb pilin [Clostridium sp.]